ncbi:hypothetical protein MNEG_10840 [Monoraphidium neglectum]|uniref:Protein kinase domain-containing protein n=1 Tax=Monoraphidium neglectum TaxID=145388 RepID=A0A0D2KN81_9CHLO|nr:hypothetical protein MNEG_10840 [Monoraphidium neglectum]KIY97123.1 hypothetical protein MNEG_10840 [Monoraphidium neglectum]|eukprot:XP_013896143.1 hypothetical protein MNEG_10840 [Monoraphidium neglectum]
MAVDFVGICVYADDEPGCALLLAMHGDGAAALERHTVMRGPAWSAARLAGEGAPALECIRDVAATKPEAPLAPDVQLLHAQAGIRSFVSVAIGPAGDPFGTLLLGRRQPNAFDDHWSAIWPTAVATGLLCHVRPAPVARAVRMLRTIDEAADPVSAISAALQSGARFMRDTTNIAMGARLALLDGPSMGSALIFESVRADAAASRTPACRLPAGSANSSCRSVLLPADPAADVTVRELPLSNTLLASAVSLRKARFVKDCASYIQNCPTPARDVFTHASHLVSSLVVVPLLVEDRALGALYFTQDAPCDFSNIQDALLGFVHAVTPTLHSKLSGQMAELRALMTEVISRRRSSLGTSAVQSSDKLLRHAPGGGGANSGGNSGSSEATSCDLETHDADVTIIASAGPPSSASARLSKVSSRQLCTEAMLKVLQQEIRKGRRRSAELAACADLVTRELIGRGGFGCVYKGTWHTIPAAIKIMNCRKTNSEAVSDAMEMAVLSNHDSLESCASAASHAPSAGAVARPRFRRLMPGEGAEDTYNIVVMELCDRCGV